MRLRDRFRDKQRTKIDKKDVSKDVTEDKDTYFLNENYFAGFVQDQFWFTNTTSLLPGVRIEHVRLRTHARNSPQDGRDSTPVNPSLHFLYQMQENLSLRVAFSRGVTRPKFDELSPFTDEKGDRFVIGNPRLRPARLSAWRCQRRRTATG